MSNEKLHASADVWTRFAPAFSKAMTSQSNATGPAVAPNKAMLAALHALRPLSSATTIHDVGSGPGQVTSLLLDGYAAQLPAGATVVASDSSAGMVEQVRARKASELAAGNADWERVSTALLDVRHLATIADDSVSHVTAGFLFFLTPDPRAGLVEVRRVLTTQAGGGALALSSWLRADWLDATVEVLSTVSPTMTLPRMPANWDSVEGVRGEMQAAGFRHVQTAPVDTYWDYETPAKMVAALIAMPLLQVVIRDMSEGDRARVEGLMQEWLRAKNGDGKGRLLGVAITGVGRK
ncbi:MAG: hypothetical protein M1818_006319 [Claussenomyces sp. TS43310]|nr:MAG: hypothetical protein M1818_006319 [Claussenomyces sp. TS43310]